MNDVNGADLLSLLLTLNIFHNFFYCFLLNWLMFAGCIVPYSFPKEKLTDPKKIHFLVNNISLLIILHKSPTDEWIVYVLKYHA